MVLIPNMFNASPRLVVPVLLSTKPNTFDVVLALPFMVSPLDIYLCACFSECFVRDCDEYLHGFALI